MEISRLSTQYVVVKVKGTALSNGLAIDPTQDAAAMAFVRRDGSSPGPNPADEDWHDAEWGYLSGGWYRLGLLVGPEGGALELNAGAFDVWARFTDEPEAPVVRAGELVVY